MEQYLEKVFTEYTEYKTYLQNNLKPIEELRKEVAQKVGEDANLEQMVETTLEKVGYTMLQQQDFQAQTSRLFFTVEALKNEMEIPKEVLEQVKALKFNQAFAIKNNKAEVIDQNAINFTREQLEKEANFNLEKFKENFLGVE